MGQFCHQFCHHLSRYSIFKRFFTGESLADEVQGDVLYDGRYFVVTASERVT